MIEGKTKSGFKFAIDERIGKDWRLITNISLVENGDSSDQLKGTTEIVHLLLGKNEQKFMEHIAKKNEGYVPIEAVIDELRDIISATKETKNS